MAAGLVNLTFNSTNSGTSAAVMWSDSGATSGNLQPLSIISDTAKNPLLISTNPGYVKISDGTNVPGVAPATTAVTTSQPALAVALSPNTPLPSGANVLGAVTQSGAFTVGQTGSWTVTANAGTGTFTTSDLADGSVAGGTAGTKSLLIGGQYNSSPPSLTSGQQSAAQIDGSGNLKVNIVAGSTGNAAASATGAPVPTSADYLGVIVGSNLTGVTGKTASSATGACVDLNSVGGSALAFGQATMSASVPVVIASNQSAVPSSQSGTWTVGLSSGSNTVGNVNQTTGTAGFEKITDGTNTAAVKAANTAAAATDPALVVAVSPNNTVATSDLADGSVTGGTAGTKSLLSGGQYNSSAPTLTTGQQAALQLDASGNLKVNIITGGGGGGANAAAGATGSAVPADGSYNAVNIGGTLRGQTGSNPIGTTYSAHTDITSVAGATVNTGHGTASGSIRVELPTDGTGVVGLNAGSNIVGTVTQIIANPTSTLTRPANTTPYAQNNLIASNTTAGSVTVPSFTAARVSSGNFYIRALRLTTNVTTGWNGATFNLTLWTAAPTYTNGDGGAYAVATGSANWLRTFTGTFTQFGDGAAAVAVPAPGQGAEVGVALASGQAVYWDLQYTGAANVTPISGQTFSVAAEDYQN